MQLFNLLYSEKTMRNWEELINMEWKDYDDFEHKYGSDTNPDNFAKRQNIWFTYDGIGFLHKQGLISPDMIYQIGSTTIVWQWKKFEDIIRYQREYYHFPDQYRHWEELVKDIEKMRISHGHFAEPPETYSQYIKNKSRSNP
jgi:hypothetical protein